MFAKRIHHFFRTTRPNRVAMELRVRGRTGGRSNLSGRTNRRDGDGPGAVGTETCRRIYGTLLLRPKISPVQGTLLTIDWPGLFRPLGQIPWRSIGFTSGRSVAPE